MVISSLEYPILAEGDEDFNPGGELEESLPSQA